MDENRPPSAWCSAPPVPYHVELQGVREVTLEGVADLRFWEEKLRPEGLYPARDAQGRSELLLSASEGRFHGIRFREASVSVFVSRTAGGSTRDGAFLVQAFNSLRFFALVERAVFGTPYRAARIQLQLEPFPSLSIAPGEAPLIRVARMPRQHGGTATEPMRRREEGWAGPVFLPSAATTGHGLPALFHAKIGGLTEVFEFRPEVDSLELTPRAEHPVVGWLVESRFRPVEWHVRASAIHGKSRTVRRGPSPFAASRG